MYRKLCSFIAVLLVFTFIGCRSDSTAINSQQQKTANQTANSGAANAADNLSPAAQSKASAEMNHAQMNHSEMQSAPDATSQPYDLQFLDTMISHHQGAVDMAKPAASKAEHAELKTLAANIIADQEKEIARMKQWREKWFAGKPSALNMEMTGMSDSMKGMDMSKFDVLSGGAYDIEFINQMTLHHQGAVVMARDALGKAEHSEIKTLAAQIIKAQEAEIKLMQDWKARWSK